MNQGEAFYYGAMETPLGMLTLVTSQTGLCYVKFGTPHQIIPSVKAWMIRHFLKQDLVEDNRKVAEPRHQLEEYFQGNRKTFQLALDLYGTPFQRKVWEQLRLIKYGETLSYKQIAQAIGAPKAVRAVGGANNRNPVSIIVPCHRVIGTNGALVGYGGGLDKKEYLLNLEKNNVVRLSS